MILKQLWILFVRFCNLRCVIQDYHITRVQSLKRISQKCHSQPYHRNPLLLPRRFSSGGSSSPPRFLPEPTDLPDRKNNDFRASIREAHPKHTERFGTLAGTQKAHPHTCPLPRPRGNPLVARGRLTRARRRAEMFEQRHWRALGKLTRVLAEGSINFAATGELTRTLSLGGLNREHLA